MLPWLKRAINASVASSDHLTLVLELDAILDLIHNSQREEKVISFPGTLGLVINIWQLRPKNMGTAPLKNRHRTTYSHGPGTPKFLDTGAHKISIYTIKTEETVHKI